MSSLDKGKLQIDVGFEYYKVFYHIYAHGSLTTAAQELCTSQPVVSQAVWQLEKGAGTKLFLRTPKGVQLTREGELLYHCIKLGAEGLLGGGKMLERVLNMDMGEVWIRANDMTLQFYLLPYLEQSRREHPEIKVNVANAPTPEAIGDLEEGRIDFGVMTSPFTSRGAVRQFQVKTIRNAFVTGSSFRELEGRKLEYRELEAFPCITLEKNTGTRTFMDVFLAQQGALLESEFELVISDIIMRFAKHNMGTGCIMEGLAEDAIIGGEIFRLKFKHEVPLRYICVVTGESSLISMPGHRLLDMMACGQVAAGQPTDGK